MPTPRAPAQRHLGPDAIRGHWGRRLLEHVRDDGAACALLLAWPTDDAEVAALLALDAAELEALARQLLQPLSHSPRSGT